MTLTRIVSAAATVALAAALLVTLGGMALAAAQPRTTLSGYPTFDNTMTVSNETWSDNLSGPGSETNWYHCGDYHKIVTPNGVMSAYPYGPMSWGISSGSGWTSEATHGTATASNMDRGSGDLQILFINATNSGSTSKIRMDCTGVYPGYETTGITVQSPTGITATTATINASVSLYRPPQVCESRAYVEYGSAPDVSYERQSSMVVVPHDIMRSQFALPPITLTGLTPGTTYHYRVVFDEGDCFRNVPPNQAFHRNYGAPNNTFTTADSPPTDRQIYGIASFADGRAFIDVPNGSPAVGLSLQLFQGNGSPAQQWGLDDLPDGYFLIVGAPGRCLEIRGGAIADAPIDQDDCGPAEQQRWQPVQQPDGSFVLKSKGGGGLLLSSAGGTANGTGLVARTATATPMATQKWSFIPLRAWDLGAERPARRKKSVRCRGTARRCRAKVGIAGGAVNRKIVIRLPGRNLRMQSVEVFPRRIATIADERAAGSEQLYSFSHVRFKPRRRRFVVILNAAEASPPGSHLIVTFKGPRQRDRQRRRP
jgi:hypothetical protein